MYSKSWENFWILSYIATVSRIYISKWNFFFCRLPYLFWRHAPTYVCQNSRLLLILEMLQIFFLKIYKHIWILLTTHVCCFLLMRKKISVKRRWITESVKHTKSKIFVKLTVLQNNFTLHWFDEKYFDIIFCNDQ